MSSAQPSFLQEFTSKYKDALIITGVIVAAITSSSNLAINADMPTESGNAAIRKTLGEISTRLSAIEYDVDTLSRWQSSKEEQLDGRGAFMSCAVQQIQENRRAANAEKVCDIQVPR